MTGGEAARPLLLVGRARDAEPPRWTRRPSAPGVDAGFSDCHPTTDGVLVHGWSRERSALWHPTDGRSFSRIDLPAGQQMGEIERVGDVLVAPGTHRDGSRDAAVLWHSRDGRTWQNLDLPDRTLVRADWVVPSDEGLLVAVRGDAGLSAVLLENPAEVLTGQ